MKAVGSLLFVFLGARPWSLRIRHTVDAPTRCPSPTSSPWIRRYPHVGFSVAISSISRRVPAAVSGLPSLRRGRVQWRATRRRCHRNKVSGVTIHPARARRASACATAPSRARSSSVMAGRSTWRRSTASWWRSTMISRSFERPERTTSAMRPITRRYKVRCITPRSAHVHPGQPPRPSFGHPHLLASQVQMSPPSAAVPFANTHSSCGVEHDQGHRLTSPRYRPQIARNTGIGCCHY